MSFRKNPHKKNVIQPEAPRASQPPSNKLTNLPNDLVVKISSYLVDGTSPHQDTKTLVNLSESSASLYQKTETVRQKQALEKLLAAMLDHYPLKVSSILTSYPELTFAKPEDYNIKEMKSQFTGLQYQTSGESVFRIAQKLLLVDMLEIMLDKAQNIPDAKLVALELETQWTLPIKETEEAQQKLRDSYIEKYLLPPITALAQDNTIEVNIIRDTDDIYESSEIHMSADTDEALKLFRKNLLEPRTIKECIDINQLLIAAYHAYDRYDLSFQNQNQRNAFAILVIGFIQSLVHPSLGKAYCQNLNNVVNVHEDIGSRAKSLMLENKHSFYREQNSEHGLGFDYYCSSHGRGPRGSIIDQGIRGPGGVYSAMSLECYVKQLYQKALTLYNIYIDKADLRQKPDHRGK